MQKAHRIHRLGEPGNFRYIDGYGSSVIDSAIVSYIEGLKIPPAWTEVEISAKPKAKLLATGFDAAGRKQYLYNPAFRQRMEREKFDRLLAFANALPMMRQVTSDHLRHPRLDRQKVLACMVRLIDQAYFRVGSERYAAENHTYGLTTLQPQHLRIEGDDLIFDYVGKSHKLQHKVVEDGQLAQIVAQLDELPGREIFKYYDEDGQLTPVRSDDLNAYIKEVMGYDFSAKDFRTWAGTLIAAVALAEVAKADTQTAKKHAVVQAVKTVAEKLGNTPAIARASYIDPRIIDHYLSGTTIRAYLRGIENLADSSELGAEEVAVLKLLQRRLGTGG